MSTKNYSHTTSQPPHGYVRYIDHLGTDASIVQAARVSYAGGSKGKEQDKKLLMYLFKNRHTSPFEQCSITFNIKFPIFLMRQFVRHRMFRLNEWSGRYSELKDEFFIPTEWRGQNKEGNKQGSLADAKINQDNCHIACKEAYQSAYDAYQTLLHYGVAKEQARFVLPVGIYTEIFVNCDLHNLMHFLRLRQDGHAQSEIQDVANAMAEIARGLFPWTFEAFDRYKMIMIDTQTPINTQE